MITQERLKELLHYDQDIGVFVRKVRTANRVRVGDKAGCIQALPNGKSYSRISIDGNLHYAHRLAWLWNHGELPPHEIDHINGDGTDNRLCNLRSATSSENSRNRRLHSNNASGTCGVYWYEPSRKWVARIMVDSKLLHLGYFEDIDDAIAARKEAEIEHGYHPNHGSNRPL